jgi:hypothetical protein
MVLQTIRIIVSTDALKFASISLLLQPASGPTRQRPPAT